VERLVDAKQLPMDLVQQPIKGLSLVDGWFGQLQSHWREEHRQIDQLRTSDLLDKLEEGLETDHYMGAVYHDFRTTVSALQKRIAHIAYALHQRGELEAHAYRFTKPDSSEAYTLETLRKYARMWPDIADTLEWELSIGHYKKAVDVTDKHRKNILQKAHDDQAWQPKHTVAWTEDLNNTDVDIADADPRLMREIATETELIFKRERAPRGLMAETLTRAQREGWGKAEIEVHLIEAKEALGRTQEPSDPLGQIKGLMDRYVAARRLNDHSEAQTIFPQLLALLREDYFEHVQ